RKGVPGSETQRPATADNFSKCVYSAEYFCRPIARLLVSERTNTAQRIRYMRRDRGACRHIHAPGLQHPQQSYVTARRGRKPASRTPRGLRCLVACPKMIEAPHAAPRHCEIEEHEAVDDSQLTCVQERKEAPRRVRHEVCDGHVACQD